MRSSTVLIISLIVQAVCWTVVAGLRATMNITLPQYLFGVQIPHSLSMGLCMLVLGGVPLSGLGIIICVVLIAKRQFGPTAAG